MRKGNILSSPCLHPNGKGPSVPQPLHLSQRPSSLVSFKTCCENRMFRSWIWHLLSYGWSSPLCLYKLYLAINCRTQLISCVRQLVGIYCCWRIYGLIFVESLANVGYGFWDFFPQENLINEIKWNANLMQLRNFIDVFLARHVSGTHAHHQEN